MSVIRTIGDDEFERKKRFRIEPYRKFSVKMMDIEVPKAPEE